MDWNPNNMYVPFSAGRFLSFTSSWTKNVHWLKVEPFSMSFKVADTERGRSSVLFWIKDTSTELEYPLSFNDFMTIFEDSVFDDARCMDEWRFTFKKKGANYFVVPLNKVEG